MDPKHSFNINITDLLIKHEGIRLFPYSDTTGHLTIGVGRNLTDRGISTDEAHLLLSNDIQYFTSQLYALLPWTQSHPDSVKLVLINMIFNLGISGLLRFNNTLNLIKSKNYKMAADEMLISLWAQQVGSRAVELSNILRSV
jgi:lysozyme